MIDNIYGGEFMVVTSNKGAVPYINTMNPITGMVAYDGSSQNIKVFDGNNWMTVGGGSATVNLSHTAVNILKWAEHKMLEEAERNKLAETNPAIKDLVNQIKEKEEQLKVVTTLLKEEVKV
jgi:uncharacterized spore protein YtfJ